MFSLLHFLIPSVPNVVDVFTQLPGECDGLLEPDRLFRTADVKAFPTEYARVLVHLGCHNKDPVNWLGMREHFNMLIALPALTDRLRHQLKEVQLKLGLDQPD